MPSRRCCQESQPQYGYSSTCVPSDRLTMPVRELESPIGELALFRDIKDIFAN